MNGNYSTGLELRAETQLLLLAARAKPGAENIKRIRLLAHGSVDWLRLVQQAKRHRVLPLLYQNLNQACGDDLHAQFASGLHEYYRDNAELKRLHTEVLEKTLALFADRQLPVVPFKGVTLAHMAYGDLSAREIGDIDLLVRPADYLIACNLLESHGLRCTEDYGYECSFIDDQNDVCLDLHQALAANGFPVRLDFEYLQKRLTLMPVAGRQLPSLPPEETLLIQCVQVAKDGWVQRCLLYKVCDIAELLRAHQATLAWGSLQDSATNSGCLRILHLGLLLAHWLLDAPLPVAMASRLCRDRRLRALACHVCVGLFEDDEVLPSYCLDERKYYRKLRERWLERYFPYQESWRAMFFRPNAKDQAFLPLPDTLSSLYYVIRPLRLARDVGWRFLKRLLCRC